MVGTSNLGSWNGHWAGPVLVKSGSLVVNFNDAFYQDAAATCIDHQIPPCAPKNAER